MKEMDDDFISQINEAIQRFLYFKIEFDNASNTNHLLIFIPGVTTKFMYHH
jgi:hypothetical protein